MACSPAMVSFIEFEHCDAFRAAQHGQALVPKNPALDEIHDVEGAAEDEIVQAQGVHPRDGNTRVA